MVILFIWYVCISLCTEWSIERQVLHNQCKRLETQNYNLTRTAEQLSITMGVSEITDLHQPFCVITHDEEGRKVWLFLLSDVSGAGDSQAEGERGAGETAGPAGALQEVFDITQHSLGQGASQRAHAEVTPEACSVMTSKPDIPPERKALVRREAAISCHLYSASRFSG